MSTTQGQAAARIPEGFAEPGCGLCARIAGTDLSGYWRVTEDSAFSFPGRKRGSVIAVPAMHSAEGQGKDPAVRNAWLAAYASENAASRGIERYDLVITEEGGHPYAEIVPRGITGRARRRALRVFRRGAHHAG